MGRHHHPRRPLLERVKLGGWAWGWEEGRRTLGPLAWLVGGWALAALLAVGLTISDRLWHPDSVVTPVVRETLTEKDPPR